MREEVIVHIEPKSSVAESFRTLRTNISFTQIDKKVRTILITSCFPGEGKSWVSANLAITFAQAGKRVLLIDTDLRKGRQDLIFKAKDGPGLSNLLSGVKADAADSKNDEIDFSEYITSTEVPNLMIMSTGNLPPNPSELLSSGRLIEVLEILKQEYDIIMLDGTPSSIVADSIILSRIADATIIVTVARKTQREALIKLKKSIENVGGKIAGVVLNKVAANGKEYTYQYYRELDPDVKKKNMFKRNRMKMKAKHK